jgi:hypothetical protein
MNTTTESGVKSKILNIKPRPSVTAGMTDEEFEKWLRSLGAVPISPQRKLELEKAGVWRERSWDSQP